MPDQLLIDASDERHWAAVAERLQRALHVSILTGAGVSAESGLPTFRANGLWEAYRVEEVATPGAFARDPELVWRFYNERRRLVAHAVPNDGHRALVELAALGQRTFTLITQNVDGLHQAAGSEGVVELHGSLRRVQCTRCGDSRLSLDPLPPLPTCPCGGLLRPGVVWFGEALPEEALQTAWSAVNRSDVLLVAGTSAVVYPAAGLIHQARQCGVCIIEVNPAETEATSLAEIVLRGPSARMLPRLVAELETLN